MITKLVNLKPNRSRKKQKAQIISIRNEGAAIAADPGHSGKRPCRTTLGRNVDNQIKWTNFFKNTNYQKSLKEKKHEEFFN